MLEHGDALVGELEDLLLSFRKSALERCLEEGGDVADDPLVHPEYCPVRANLHDDHGVEGVTENSQMIQFFRLAVLVESGKEAYRSIRGFLFTCSVETLEFDDIVKGFGSWRWSMRVVVGKRKGPLLSSEPVKSSIKVSLTFSRSKVNYSIMNSSSLFQSE